MQKKDAAKAVCLNHRSINHSWDGVPRGMIKFPDNCCADRNCRLGCPIYIPKAPPEEEKPDYKAVPATKDLSKKEEPLFENPTPEVPLEAQTIRDPDDISIIEAKIKNVTAARDHARNELMGLENQLYVLKQLINPETTPNEQKNEKPPQGLPTPDGTI